MVVSLKRTWQTTLRYLTIVVAILRNNWRTVLLVGFVGVGTVLMTLIIRNAIIRWGQDWLWATWADEKFFGGKTVWDWLELLIIPVVLALGAFWLNRSERISEQENEKDQQQDTVLQAYIDWVREFVQNDNGHLQTENMRANIRAIARTKTQTTLARLDSSRKRQLLKFLFDANLVTKSDPPILLYEIDLHGIDLHKANLSGIQLARVDFSRANLQRIDLSKAEIRVVNFFWADLRNALLQEAKLFEASLKNVNLCGTKLSEANLTSAVLENANLQRADLSGAILRFTNLSNADLTDADLSNADLSGANLSGAKVTDEQLAKTSKLIGAKMPDGRTLNQTDQNVSKSHVIRN